MDDEEIAQTLREATRAAREAIKDMNDAVTQFNAAVTEARKGAARWREEYEQSLKEEWEKGLAEYHKSLNAAVADHSRVLEKRLDIVCSMLTKPYDTPRGRLSLTELVALKTGNAIPAADVVQFGTEPPPPARKPPRKRKR